MQIRLNNVCMIFGDKIVFKNINKTLYIEDVICITGDSGVGKTTLTNLITKNSKPTSGEIIYFNDNDIKISIMPQSNKLLENLTVFENIFVFSETKDVSQIKKLVSELAILDKLDTPVKNLSGGQKQRVNFARSLINNPDLIVLDEPTGNLDDLLVTEIIYLIKKFKDLSCKFIIVSHDTRILNEFTSHVLVNNGLIVDENTGNIPLPQVNLKHNKFNPLLLFKASFKVNMLVRILSVVPIIFILISIFVINLLTISTNNVFIDTVNGFYGSTGGRLVNTYNSTATPENCEKIMQFETCNSGDINIPDYLYFSEEEIEYLQKYDGFESITFSYDNSSDSNIALTRDLNVIDNYDVQQRALKYSQTTGDEYFLQEGITLQAGQLLAPISELINYGTFALPKEVLNPLYGEVHDLQQDEIIISNNLANVIANEQGVDVENLIGSKVQFKTVNSTDYVTKDNVESVFENSTIEYKIAWIYQADGSDTYYLPELQNKEVNMMDLDSGYLPTVIKNPDYIYIPELSMYDDILASDSYSKSDQELISALRNNFETKENYIEASHTGISNISYKLKSGFDQEDLQIYLNNGPEVLKYRSNENPQKLFLSESYNDNDTRIFKAVGISLLFLIISAIFQSFYFKRMFDEFKVARLMGATKMYLNKLLFSYLILFLLECIPISIVITVITMHLLSGIMVINLYFVNYLIICTLVGLLMILSTIFQIIKIARFDITRELHE